MRFCFVFSKVNERNGEVSPIEAREPLARTITPLVGSGSDE